ncbi:BH3-interacting domain death agonist [Octodon degus]|uniref:BH3-interacting domain death agonist n=1 Tax=Octodon degus TaxID=10160 RepID=A0A6P6F642_OCTDE|nr:BH3-interacting domain death agonist [Octodon degus]
MDTQIGNGAGLGDAHVTNLLLLGFLQSRNNYNFHQELKSLRQELPVGLGADRDDDELQTDGNRASRPYGARRQADSESLEEITLHIARQLATIGDEMNHRIQPRVVSWLSAQLRDPSLSEEGRRRCLASTVRELMQTCPADLEQEKATLILTMLLARRVADQTPALLRVVFHTATDFINQNLLPYVRDLVRNERD